MRFFVLYFCLKADWNAHKKCDILISQTNQNQEVSRHAQTDVKSLNADLKAKKASVKKLDKEVAKLEARQAAAAQKAAEASKKAEAEDVLKKLLASGVSADEILEKLK